MSRPVQPQMVVDWSAFRPGRVVLTLILVNVLAFVIEMVLIRSGVLDVAASPLSLIPAQAFSGMVWQVATAVLLHSPVGTSHLLGNMLFLWIFGSSLEREEGGASVLRAYILGGLIGSAVALGLGMVDLVVGPGLLGIFEGLWHMPNLGASGACMSVAFAWLARHYFEVLNLMFLGPIRGRTLMAIMIGIEFLNMLALSNVGWGPHLGGIATGMALGFGWWRPSVLRNALRRRQLAQKGRRIEKEIANLRVLEGGKDKPQGRQGRRDSGDDWVH